jgi:hypothetical protein
MARTRLIAIAVFADGHDRILSCFSEAATALAAIMAEHTAPPASGQLFVEEPDNAYPKMIQVRLAYAGEAKYLGRIIVDRGNVDLVLADLRQGMVK